MGEVVGAHEARHGAVREDAVNAAQVVEKLSKAIAAVESFREAIKQCPKESSAAVKMFTDCYPKREKLIRTIADVIE